MHDKSGLMIAQTATVITVGLFVLPGQKLEAFFFFSQLFARLAAQTVTVCRHSVAQKQVIFSEKMNRESESFSPTESVKQSRTKVMLSEIKEKDSRRALHLCSSLPG